MFLRVWVDSFSSVRARGFIKVILEVIIFLFQILVVRTDLETFVGQTT